MHPTLKGEIIGLNILVTHSNNKTLVGINGKVVDETRDIITIKTKNGEIIGEINKMK